jgi:MFS family permease
MNQAVGAITQARPSPTVAWYTVIMCMIAYVLSFVDRQIIALLIEPIQADLQITDTQFSLLTGLAFSLFYATMGLPIARWADVGSRPFIIAAGIVVWSFATAVCGLTRTYWQLFLARMGVGVGEAALSPAAYSIISDSFPKSKLGLAMGVYSIGVFLGSGLAFLVGGTVIEIVESYGGLTLPFIGDIKPWQATFFLVGLPGIHELLHMFAIQIQPLALVVWPFVPVQPQPLEGVKNLIDGFLGRAHLIGILDPQDERATLVSGKQPVVERRTGIPDMQKARRTWRKSHSNMGV